MLAHLLVELVVGKDHAVFVAKVQIGDCHWREVHVAAAHVQQPGYLVEGGDEDALGTGSLHLLHGAGELALHILAGIFHVVDKGLVAWHFGTVVPYCLVGIEVGGEQESVLAAHLLQAVGVHQREQAAVDGEGVVFAQLLSKPLHENCHVATKLHILQLKPAALELYLGLEEVARVGPQACCVEGYHCCAVAAGKPTHPVAEFPVVAHIFTLMRVGARDDNGIHTLVAHQLAQLF